MNVIKEKQITFFVFGFGAKKRHLLISGKRFFSGPAK